MMKNINVAFEDNDYFELSKAKGKMGWREWMLSKLPENKQEQPQKTEEELNFERNKRESEEVWKKQHDADIEMQRRELQEQYSKLIDSGLNRDSPECVALREQMKVVE